MEWFLSPIGYSICAIITLFFSLLYFLKEYSGEYKEWVKRGSQPYDVKKPSRTILELEILLSLFIAFVWPAFLIVCVILFFVTFIAKLAQKYVKNHTKQLL